LLAAANVKSSLAKFPTILATSLGWPDAFIEAKVKLSVHLCSEHAPAAKEMLQRFITEMKSSVQTPVI
jgi:hypothetical protein